MKHLKTKYFLSVMLLLASIMPVFAFNAAKFEQEINQKEPDTKRAVKRDDDNDCNVIKVGKLKADRVLARCIDAKKIDTECIDADHVRAFDVSAERAYLAALCTQTICASQFVSSSVDAQSVATNDLSAAGNTCLSNLRATNACISRLTANDLCVSGTLTALNILNCEKVRAYISLSGVTTYTLGTDIPFDVINDDPNGNVSFSPTRYTAPVSGYYVVSLHTDLSNLQNGTQILGAPVAELQVQVNGLDSKEVYQPFLSFLNGQKAFLSSIIRLNAGDVVTSVLNVLVLDQSAGVINLTGTVDLNSGTFPGDTNSFFAIHLLSNNCIDLPCAPCVPDCTPSTPLTCGPCTALPGCQPCNPCVPCNPCQCP